MSAQQGQGNAGLVTRLLAAAVDAVAVVIATARALPRCDGHQLLLVTAAVPVAAAESLDLDAHARCWSRRHTSRSRGRPQAAATAPPCSGSRALARSRRRLGWIRAMLRAITCVLVPIGLLWTAISPARRSWQDILVGTVVVYDRYRDGGEHATSPNRVASVAHSGSSGRGRMLGFLIVPLVPIVLMALALSLAYVEARLPAPGGGRHPDVTQLRQPRVGAIRADRYLAVNARRTLAEGSVVARRSY